MPPRIAVLPSDVVDQIAAGEVVERPASVVKELLENALDAGARSIEIEVEQGGRARIRVADDGSGMERDDARLALERHATSKIRGAGDLVGVASFGFRGEALPAIASVCDMEVETSPDGGEGTRLCAAGGSVTDTRQTSRRSGTTVTVSRLFFNTPARQKFLRSARSEWRAIADVITTAALARRDVRFAVTHDGRAAMMLPPASSLRARAAALWGAALSSRLVDVDDVSGAIHVSGLVERPADVSSSGRKVYISVNGRVIRDAGIVRAAEAAYRSTIPAGARPTLLLDLVVPGNAIDVNVHPAKAEVRFLDRWVVERAVESAVRRALGTRDSAATLGPRAWLPRESGPVLTDRELFRPASRNAEPLFDGPASLAATAAATLEREQTVVPPLLQFRGTYLMFERDDGLVLVDQHSAHERVLYERFLRTLESGEAPSQRLLFPLTMHLGPVEGDAFEESRDLFEQLGFEIEGFGGHTLIVRSVPMPHPRFDAERCLRETLDALAGSRSSSVAPRHERLAATVACKAAIKAGDAMSEGEMRALFLALAATTLPAHDVHGRSTIVHVTWDEIERRFGRR